MKRGTSIILFPYIRYFFAVFYLLLVMFCQAQSWPADTITTTINSNDPAFPFPQFLEYDNGKSLAMYNAIGVTHCDMERATREAYHIMMHRAVYTGEVLDGVQYIKFNDASVPDNANTFVSEGDGYALLAAAYMGDKATFDGLWLWLHDNRLQKVDRYLDCAPLRPNYANGYTYTCGWDNDATTPVATGNPNDAASDGDFDIGLALLMAHRQWGEWMNVDPCGPAANISYRQEAIRFLTTLVDTFYYDQAYNGAAAGTEGYLTGDIGIDGYVKNGNTWNEVTDWRYGAANTAYPWASAKPDPLQVRNFYIDYVAPAYFRQFGDFLQANGASTWVVNQYRRAEASSDWLIGDMYSKGLIPQAGQCSVSDDGSTVSYGPHPIGPLGEDFRLPWRTILNYVWHGNPTETWDPVAHEPVAGGNSYEYDMAVRYAAFLKNQGPLDGSGNVTTPLCQQMGASPDPGSPFFKGVQGISQAYLSDGTRQGAAFHTNYSNGTAGPAAVAAEDTDFLAEIYRQCELKWDDEDAAMTMAVSDQERYYHSTPIYFHGWFRLLGMLVMTGNAHAPSDMVPSANMKVYMDVDKTFAYEGDVINYTVSYRNYGSVDANNVVVTTPIPAQYDVVTVGGGGTYSGGNITWNLGTIPGFKSATGINPTEGSMTFQVRVKIGATGRPCLTSTISTTNGTGWTSNEYPNNCTYTMERNCVDILGQRALLISKQASLNAVNPGDTVCFTLNFENSTSAGFLDGGRQGVNVSFGTGEHLSNTAFMYFRVWHAAHEAYIDLGNYRASYFINDVSNVGLYDAATNPTGWSFSVNNLEGGNPADVQFGFESIPFGSDANGSWNQRFIIRFAPALSAPTATMYDYINNAYQLHRGVYRPMKMQLQVEANPSTALAPKFADDWSWEPTNDVGANDKHLLFPITDNWEDPNNPGIPVTNYTKDVCSPIPGHSFDRMLIEEYDGYTWRRILGNSPLPGREISDVTVVDTIPAGLTFLGFTDSIAEGIEATYNAGCNCITWTIPSMLAGMQDELSYCVTADGTCPMSDVQIINKAWIYSPTDSPLSSEDTVLVTCDALPPPPPPVTTMTKVADQGSYTVGDSIIYTVNYEQTHGTIADPALTNNTDWTAWEGTPLPNISGGSISPQWNSKPLLFTHNYSHGTDGTFEFDIAHDNWTDMGIVFRYQGGHPKDGNFDGVFLRIKFGSAGLGTIQLEAYNDMTPVANPPMFNSTFTTPHTNPRLRIVLDSNTMSVWINDFTGPAIYVTSDISVIQPGWVGFYNGHPSGSAPENGNHTINDWYTDFDSAFDVFFHDPLPGEVTFGSANQSGALNGGNVEWSVIPGPVLKGTTFTRIIRSVVNSCDANGEIVNTAYVDTKGKVPAAGAQVTVQCNDNTVPVEWLSFNARLHDAAVLLDWSTATETDNNYFEVQRSTDAKNFTTLGTVEGSGNANTTSTYDFTDTSPLEGVTYYRIKQVDYDGAASYSGTRTVNKENALSVTIEPNPFEDATHISVYNYNNEQIHVVLTSATGITVVDEIADTHIEMDIGSDLSNGFYYLRVIAASKVISKKLIKNQ